MAENEKPASQEEADALAAEAAQNALDPNDPNFVGPINENAAVLAAPLPDTLNPAPVVESVPATTEQAASQAAAVVAPEKAPAQLTPEQIADAELKAGLEILSTLVIDVKKREEERLASRYPERKGFLGLLSNINKWMETKDAGKVVKTVCNIVLGAGEIVGAAALPGTPAMLAAPALFGDGVGRIASAITEAGQFWLGKDKDQRVCMQTIEKQMMDDNADLKKIQEAYRSTTEMTTAEAKGYYDAMSKLVGDIRANDEKMLELHNKNVDTKNHDKNVRAVVRVATTLIVGGVHGIPLGHQNFDADGLSHAVRVSGQGFDFMLNGAEKAAGLAQTLHGYLGSVGHAVGTAMPTLAKWGLALGAIGVGIGVAREMKKNGHIEQAPIAIDNYAITPPVAPTPRVAPLTPGLTTPDVPPTNPDVTPAEPTPEEMKNTIEENNKKIAEIGKERTAKSTELNEAADKEIEGKSQETRGKTHNIDIKLIVLNGVIEGKEPADPDNIPDGTFSDDENSKMAEIANLKERSGENKKEKAETIKKRKNLKERKATLDSSKATDETRSAEIQAELDANKEKIASPDLAADRDAVNQLEDENAKLNVELDAINDREEERKTVEAEFAQITSELGELTAEEDEINEQIKSTQEELNKSIQTKIEDLKNEQGALIDEMKKFMEATDAKLKTGLEAMAVPFDADIKKLQDENAALQAKIDAITVVLEDEDDEDDDEDGGVADDTVATPAGTVNNKEKVVPPVNGKPEGAASVVAEEVIGDKTQTPEKQPDAQKFADFFESKLAKINDPNLSIDDRMIMQKETFDALDMGDLVLPQGVDLANMTSSNVSEPQMDAMRLILALPDPSYKTNLAETNKIIDAGRINARNIVESSNTISNLPVEHDMLSALAGKFEGGQFQAGGAIDRFQAYLRTNEAKFKAEAKKKEDEKSLADKQEELVKAKADLDAFKAKNVTFSGGVTPEILDFQVTGEETRNAAIKTLEDEIATLSKKPEAPANAEPEAPAAAVTTETAENKPEAEVPPTVQA